MPAFSVEQKKEERGKRITIGKWRKSRGGPDQGQGPDLPLSAVLNAVREKKKATANRWGKRGKEKRPEERGGSGTNPAY